MSEQPTPDKHTEARVAAAERGGDRWRSPEDVFDAGLAVRHSMWGDGGSADQILAADDFTWPMQDYVTRYCFGETWTRPGLPTNVRSMLTLAMLVAQARPNEIKVHVRGAIANGVTRDEISEIMLHAMIYCGVPKAVEGFRVAAETIREIDAESTG